ncbi:hypothetical protein DFP97_115179 [Paenibacillus prosopidis]|uniref:Uncharacterized protein n=1 Tax=Paenibacillus prosopidis TaxID=630520 RepID=A0A368VP42_9BACL|nr:hypothetical protein DFP97_115179 [Paenibacillus prosopidis]
MYEPNENKKQNIQSNSKTYEKLLTQKIRKDKPMKNN